MTPQNFNPAIPLHQVRVSKTNPRKRFDQVALEELARSIKSRGVDTPISVRMIANEWRESESYELVCGERRYRASKLAGKTTIPALIKILTDVEVIEIQITENIQRKDMHPLEEAEGFEMLMRQINPASQHPFSVEDVMEKTGASRRHIYNRLHLLKLAPDIRQAFYDGKIDDAKARLLARIDDQKLQSEALKQLSQEYDLADCTTSEFKFFLQQNYSMQLKCAPFDIKVKDYKTPDGKIIAGACGPCPKRTGNNPDLFDDVTNKDTCSDITCFNAKRAAHLAIERAGYITKGFKIIEGKDAKKIFKSDHYFAPKKEWLLAADHCPFDKKEREYSEIIGGGIDPIIVHRDNLNQFVKIYPRDEVEKLLIEKGLMKRIDKTLAPVKELAAPKPTKNVLTDWEIRTRGYRMIRDQFAAGVPADEFRLMVNILFAHIIDYQGALPVLLPIYVPAKIHAGTKEEFDDATITMHDALSDATDEGLPRAVLDLAMDTAVEFFTNGKQIDAMLKRYGLTTGQIKKQIVEDEKIKAAAEALAKAPTPPVTNDSDVLAIAVKKAKKK